MTLVFLTIAWVLGIVAGRAVTPPGSWLVPMNVAALLATGSALILRRGRQTAPSEATSAAVLTAFVLGVTRIAILQLVGTQFQIAHYVGSTDAAIHGWVCADPDIRDTYTQITVRVESVVIKDESIPVAPRDRRVLVSGVPSLARHHLLCPLCSGECRRTAAGHGADPQSTRREATIARRDRVDPALS